MNRFALPSITRRGLLRGAGAGLGASMLPWAERPARAATEPKRLLVVFTPDGTIHDTWRPQGSMTDFTFGQILSPLEAFKSRMLVLDGVNRLTQGAGDGHEQGMTQMLTGRGNLSGQTYSTGPSIDEFVNLSIGEGRPALRLGVRSPEYASNWTRMTFGEGGNPLGINSNPYAAKQDLFGDFVPTDTGPTAEQLRAETMRRSALDYTSARMARLLPEARALDRADLEAHAAAIETLRNAPGPGDVTAACTLERLDAWTQGLDPTAHDNYPTMTQMQLELISAAFACDLSRVAVLQFSNSNSEMDHRWADADAEHHGLSHYEFGYSDPFRSDALTRIYEWHAKQLAWLLGDLEVNGLLDNTVVFWMSEMGAGESHSSENIPMVIIGDGGGHFAGGRYMDYRGQGGVSHCDVLTSICNAMGIESDGFGEAASGPLQGVT